jgi:hypothetical protein
MLAFVDDKGMSLRKQRDDHRASPCVGDRFMTVGASILP